jgi:hypothetical protein
LGRKVEGGGVGRSLKRLEEVERSLKRFQGFRGFRVSGKRFQVGRGFAFRVDRLILVERDLSRLIRITICFRGG